MNDKSGSQWRKWDLHFHTPRSHDYGNGGLTPAQLVDRLVQVGIEVVAVTDHHLIDTAFIGEMQMAATGRLTVLPGIELTSNLGGNDGIHFVAIFPENSDLQHLSNELMAKLDLATRRLHGVQEDRLYVEFPAAAGVIQDLNGLLSVHGHKKHANIENISNHLSFKQQFKTDLLRDSVDLIELSDRRYVDDYVAKVFPSIGFSVPLIVASDDHARESYPVNRCCWIKADPTFAGLQMAIREPQVRFCLDDVPRSAERLVQNKTRYIKAISFQKLPSMPPGEIWLEGDVHLNPGLVAIIGNKGSGKSALADSIGLLGSCGTSNSFSFLQRSRFCDPKTGRAQHIQATLHWHDGAPRTRVLSESIGPDEPERVKYLPQNFVENVCNDLASPGGGAFEQELKKVVFSKVSKPEQLGKKTLDELLQYRTDELRRESESLAAGLISLADERAQLDDRLDPAVKSFLEKRIVQVEEEIRVHEKAKPQEVRPPAEDPSTAEQSRIQIEALENRKEERNRLSEEISICEGEVSAQQLRAADASKLLDKLKNLETEFDRRKKELAEDAMALGLDAAGLVRLKIDRDPVATVRDDALEKRKAAQDKLDGPLPDGLKARKRDLDDHIKTAQEQLDRPNQAYQVYLEQLAGWNATLSQLKGGADLPDSLLGLQAELAELATVPVRITEVEAELERTAEKIHELRAAEAAVYTELYGPVQKFVAEHPLAQRQLRIEFRVELVEEGFAETLLSYVNQQRVGSFSGAEEGRTRAVTLVEPVHWSDWNEVREFARSVVEHLHIDKRPGNGQPVLLKNQIRRGSSVAELYAWLYGLTYLKPRYILKSDDKRLEQLSPGERGALLLVFYLLVDDSDTPLIIDQPEANLDNATVVKKLVACMRDARERRQVVIVTHNPNLAVVCDADQIIHSSLDIADGHRVTYTTGALENPVMNQMTIEVLEGGREPFNIRDDTYLVCKQ